MGDFPMCRKTREYSTLDRLIGRIEVVSRLNPAIESDEELSFVLQTLMDIVADYAQQSRTALNALMVGESNGEEQS
jgi:hypothetical protein